MDFISNIYQFMQSNNNSPESFSQALTVPFYLTGLRVAVQETTPVSELSYKIEFADDVAGTNASVFYINENSLTKVTSNEVIFKMPDVMVITKPYVRITTTTETGVISYFSISGRKFNALNTLPITTYVFNSVTPAIEQILLTLSGSPFEKIKSIMVSNLSNTQKKIAIGIKRPTFPTNDIAYFFNSTIESKSSESFSLDQEFILQENDEIYALTESGSSFNVYITTARLGS